MSLFVVSPTGAGTIEVYGGSPACDAYLAAMVGDGADAYAALDTNTRLKLLVAATRFIDRQAWQGTPTTPPVSSTTLQWPRTGVGTLDPNTVPPVLVNAVFELVALLADDASVQSAPDSGSNLQSLGAGSAQLQFFRPTSISDGNATVLPLALMQMIGSYLASADPSIAAAFAGVASGTSSWNNFRTCCSTCGCYPCCCSSSLTDNETDVGEPV